MKPKNVTVINFNNELHENRIRVWSIGKSDTSRGEETTVSRKYRRESTSSSARFCSVPGRERRMRTLFLSSQAWPSL